MNDFENGFAVQKTPELTLDPLGTSSAAVKEAETVPTVDSAVQEPDYEKMLTEEERAKVDEFSKTLISQTAVSSCSMARRRSRRSQNSPTARLKT